MLNFLDASTLAWLLPLAVAVTVALAEVARRRHNHIQKLVASAPVVEKSWWQRALGRRANYRSVRASMRALQLLVLIAIAAGAAALVCQPVLGERSYRVHNGAVRLIALVDLSWSIGARDYETVLPKPEDEPFGRHGTRDHMIKTLLERVHEQIDGNGAALCVYASKSMMLQPTFVYNWTPIWYEVDNYLRPGNVAGGTRSDLPRGLEESVNFFDATKSQGEADMIILFSDGGFSCEDEAGKTAEESRALAMARLDAQLKILEKPGAPKLVIAALGSDSPRTIPRFQLNQNDMLVKVGDLQLDGKPALVMYEPGLLESIRDRLGPQRCQFFRIKRPEDFKPNWPKLLGNERMEKGKAPAAGYIAAVLIALLFVRVLLR